MINRANNNIISGFVCWFVLLALVFGSSAAKQNKLGSKYIPPSCINRISNAELDIIISQFKPIVVETMQNASIPDLEFTTQSAGMTMLVKLEDIIFRDLQLDEIWVSTVEGMGYSAGLIGGSLLVDFSWVVDVTSYPFSYLEGSGVMSVNDLSGSAVISVTLVDFVSVAHVEEIHVVIGEFGVSVESTSSLGNLISIIVDVMSPYLSDYIGNIVGVLLTDVINGLANHSEDQNFYPIDDKVDISWLFVNGYKFTNDAGLNPMYIVYYEHGSDPWSIPYSPHTLPEKVTSDPAQMMFDFAIFDTAWYTYTKLGNFKNTSYSLFGKNFTVSLFSEFFPSLLLLFSPDTELEITFDCPKLTFSEVYYTGILRQLECQFDIYERGSKQNSDKRMSVCSGANCDQTKHNKGYNGKKNKGNKVGDDSLWKGQHMLSISALVGLAEQPALVNGNQRLGLSFYYNGASNIKVVPEPFITEDLDDPTVDLLLHVISGSSLIPFVNDWGTRISISIFNFAGMEASDTHLIFSETYVAVGYTPKLVDEWP